MIRLDDERGFTLIELLTVVMIIGSLSALAMTGFFVYKNEAYFARAQVTLHDARTALEAGYEDIVDLGALDLWSGSDGAALGGQLATMFPAMGVPVDTRMHAMQTPCGDGQNMELIIVYACTAERFTSWTRTCGGFEVLSDGVAIGMC